MRVDKEFCFCIEFEFESFVLKTQNRYIQKNR